MKLYAVEMHGVNMKGTLAICSSPEGARQLQEFFTANQRDTWHHYTISEFELDKMTENSFDTYFYWGFDSRFEATGKKQKTALRTKLEALVIPTARTHPALCMDGPLEGMVVSLSLLREDAPVDDIAIQKQWFEACHRYQTKHEDFQWLKTKDGKYKLFFVQSLTKPLKS